MMDFLLFLYYLLFLLRDDNVHFEKYVLITSKKIRLSYENSDIRTKLNKIYEY